MYTLRNPRGIERFIINVANGLAKKGHDLTLITGRCAQPVTREWIDERVRVYEIYHHNWHKLSFIPGFMNAFLTADYDIINLSIARGEGYAAGLAHLLKKFRYNIVFQYPFEEHEKHFNAFKKFGTAKYADKLVAASTYIAQGVERCFNRPAITIPNGVDPDMFHPNISRRIEMRKKLKIPEKAPVIITVAALQGRKGISKVLDAISLLKNLFPIYGTSYAAMVTKKIGTRFSGKLGLRASNKTYCSWETRKTCPDFTMLQTCLYSFLSSKDSVSWLLRLWQANCLLLYRRGVPSPRYSHKEAV